MRVNCKITHGYLSAQRGRWTELDGDLDWLLENMKGETIISKLEIVTGPEDDPIILSTRDIVWAANLRHARHYVSFVNVTYVYDAPADTIYCCKLDVDI